MSAEAVQAVAEALRVHRTDEIMAECLCGWESPHGREMRTTHCLNHQAQAAIAAARPAIEAQALDQVRAALRAEAMIRAYEERGLTSMDLWNLAGQFTSEWLGDVLRDRADRIEREADQ